MERMRRQRRGDGATRKMYNIYANMRKGAERA